MTTEPPIFRTLRSDHRRVLTRLDALERSVLRRGRAGRLGRVALSTVAGLSSHLTVQFDTHMAAEDRVLYPALRDAFPEAAASLGPLHEEHRELRSMLDRLVGLLGEPASGPRDEQVVVQVRDLVDLLRIHIRKEEATVFTVAARVLDRSAMDALEARVAPHLAARRPSRRGRKGTTS